MKILVIGDTHGKLNMVRDIWPKLRGIDLVIHTGDYSSDARELEKELRVPFAYVSGNCDGSRGSRSCSSAGGDFAVVETECGRILVTHGHNEDVKFSLQNLIYKALENDCIAAVFGHTHKALNTETEAGFGSERRSIRLVNPGSLPLSKDGSGGSYAIIRTSEDRFDSSIVYYSTVMGGGSKKSGGTGFISSLLNYSDRF